MLTIPADQAKDFDGCLQTLAEYIDDTEDLININLDSHGVLLIQTDLTITAAAFCIALVNAVSGLFGMNIWTKYEDAYLLEKNTVFNIVTILTCLFSLLSIAGCARVMRWRRLALF